MTALFASRRQLPWRIAFSLVALLLGLALGRA